MEQFIHVELEFLRLEFYKTRSRRTRYEEEQRKKVKEDFFFLNNYKTQTILLVSEGLKLFWFLTNRVQRTQFWGYKIEYIVLDFPIAPTAELDKVST